MATLDRRTDAEILARVAALDSRRVGEMTPQQEREHYRELDALLDALQSRGRF